MYYKMSLVDTQKYFEFITEKFSLNQLDIDQTNYLLAQTSSEEMVEALEKYGLKNEFQSNTSENAIIRQEQDKAYQDSLIEESIRQLSKTLEANTAEIDRIKKELEPIEISYQVSKLRFEKFPDNPNIQKEYETRKQDKEILDNKIATLSKENEKHSGELENFKLMKMF
jgi:hypothetical protein